MKYKLTPLNLISGILFIFAIYSLINPGSWGFGFMVGIFLFIVTFFLLAFDFLIQIFVKNINRIYLFEIIIIGILVFAYQFSERTKTYIIPNNFENKYVFVIYDYPKAKAFPFGWNYEIEIPNSGILYTSTTKSEDLRQTNFVTKSKLNLNSQNTDLGFGQILEDKINCNGQTYEFRIWKVQKNCCGYSSDETKKLKTELQNQICR